MSQLNQKNQIKKVVSYNGNLQYKKSSEQELYELVTMSMLGRDSYYENQTDQLDRLASALSTIVANNKLDFIGNLIVHARTDMYMRSMPIVLVVLFAKELRLQQKNYTHLRSVVCDVIQRADQLTDTYAFALTIFGDKKAIPLAIKKGVADAFNKFDEYQFGKYNSKGSLKLSDLLRIVHPKSITELQGQLFKKIIDDNLDTPYTWETQLSNAGQTGKSKTQVWEELIFSNKVGYMALLRNLRNILQANVSDKAITIVANRIADEQEVRRSKQFPFRFLNALSSISDNANSRINRAISRAVDHSLSNIPVVGKNIWIIVDCSGSMRGNPFQTASLFAAALAKAHPDSMNCKLTMFSDSAEHVNFDIDAPVFSIVNSMASEIHGFGTNLESALNLKSTLGFEPDAVVLFSDMQVNSLQGSSSKILNTMKCVKIAFNMNMYNSSPVSIYNGWYQISGWSDKVFNFISAMNEGISVTKALDHSYQKLTKVK